MAIDAPITGTPSRAPVIPHTDSIQNTPISPPDTASGPIQHALEQTDMLETFALHGLRELLFAPIPKVARALAGFDREQLGIAIEVMVAMLDAADGDPDAETGNDVEDDFTLTPGAIERATNDPSVDCVDQDQGAWIERPMMYVRSCTQMQTAGHEDDEEDDPSGQCDEDGINTRLQAQWAIGAGCTISDSDQAIDDERCDEPYQDLEREQMQHDVPMLPVYSAEHNIFTDERVSLGISNLQSSFVGKGVLSADTGAIHDGASPTRDSKPGAPV